MLRIDGALALLGLIALILGALAGCSQTLGAPPHNQQDYGLVMPPPPQPPPDSLEAQPRVGAIFVNSCFDCHAHEGSGSAGAKFAPSFLFGAVKARRALDMSEWFRYDAAHQSVLAAEIAKSVNDGTMPPGDYVDLHHSAKLTEDQKRLITQWAAGLKPAPAH
jgi:Haem-binding domain